MEGARIVEPRASRGPFAFAIDAKGWFDRVRVQSPPTPAAPSPERGPPPPARRALSVVGTIAVALVILLGLAGIGGVVTVVVLAASGGQSGKQSGGKRGKQSDPPDEARIRAPGFVPAPLTLGDEREVARALRGGTCRRNDVERTKSRYLTAMRGRGAASRLRGKVALVSFQITAPSASWTPEASRAVVLTAQTTRAYLLAQARRRGVGDLEIDPIVWPVTIASPLPPLRLGANKKPTAADGDTFRRTVRRAIEVALDRSLAAVVSDISARGYDNVAFLVSFAAGPRGIRDFAAPTGAPGEAAELAYLLEPDWNVQSRSLLATHELLHLFGADDLYEVRGVPPDEANDVMNAECDGLGTTVIGETTAYAIGWTDAAPPRSFTFSDR